MGNKSKATHFSLPLKKEGVTAPTGYTDRYQRHKEMIRLYQSIKPTTIKSETDVDILKQHHRYLEFIQILERTGRDRYLGIPTGPKVL
jgi:hypothetical protein